MKTYYIPAIMAGLACLSLFSCEDKEPETPDTPVEPTVSISLGEAKTTSVDFTLTPANAESVGERGMADRGDRRDSSHS